MKRNLASQNAVKLRLCGKTNRCEAPEYSPAVTLSGLGNPNEDGAAYNQDFLQFSVVPKDGKALKITELSFDVAGGNSAANGANRNFFVRSNLDNYQKTVGNGICYYNSKSDARQSKS